MKRASASFALASLLCLAGGLAGVSACESDWDPYEAYGPQDASVSDAADSASADAPEDRAITSTLTDGRLVTGQRPVFHWYTRDSWFVDSATLQPIHTLTLIRSDGAVIVPGCSGVATPAELASFESVATDLATVDALQQTAPCAVGDGGDDVTMTYVGLASLKHSASCDPKLQALTAAGATLVQSVCARVADGGTDAPADGP